MTTKKYIVKNLGEIDSARLAEEFEQAWYQRRQAALRKYEASRPPRRYPPAEAVSPLEEEAPSLSPEEAKR